MLLNVAPGKYYKYPVGGHGVVHDQNRYLIKMVAQPLDIEFGGAPCYTMMYGGVVWWFSVSFERNPEFEQFALKEDGRIGLSVIPWDLVPDVQNASEILRRSWHRSGIQ